MAKLSINVNDVNKMKALGLDNITLESIERTVEQRGAIEIPLDILVILSDMRCPNSKYGAYSSKELVLEMSGINREHKDVISKIVKSYTDSKGIIYLDIFNSLTNKTFEAYAKKIESIIADDMERLADRVATKCGIDLSIAYDFLNVYIALKSYNGFIMEYLIIQMLLISDRYDVLDQLNINNRAINSRALDLEWGIDILTIPIDTADINIPLQIKSKTHLRTNRDVLKKTFNNHREFKKLYDNIVDKEAKGNVYYLHYDVHSLRVALIQNREFTYALPMSRELEHTVIANPIFKYLEVWDIVEVLDEIVDGILSNVLDDSDIRDIDYIVSKEPNIDYVRFYRDIDINEVF